GPQGASGPSGPAGTTGPTAASGPTGASGPSGPVTNPDHFFSTEGDALGVGTILGNLLTNDFHPDPVPISVSSLSHLSFDATNANSAFAGFTISITDNDFSDADGSGQIQLQGPLGTATIAIKNDGTTSLSDPNNIFDPLDTGQFLIINFDYTATAGGLTT